MLISYLDNAHATMISVREARIHGNGRIEGTVQVAKHANLINKYSAAVLCHENLESSGRKLQLLGVEARANSSFAFVPSRKPIPVAESLPKKPYSNCGEVRTSAYHVRRPKHPCGNHRSSEPFLLRDPPSPKI